MISLSESWRTDMLYLPASESNHPIGRYREAYTLDVRTDRVAWPKQPDDGEQARLPLFCGDFLQDLD
jgi:hypothetical protein